MGSNWSDRLMTMGAFLCLFSGFFLMRGPATNSAQLAFRIGVTVVGVVLLIAGLVLKAKGGRG